MEKKPPAIYEEPEKEKGKQTKGKKCTGGY